MAIMDRLSENQKKFFHSIGIHSDEDIPSAFFEKIRSLKEDFSESERYIVSDYYVCYNAKMPFCMKDVVGTDHDRYSGKTWLEAFLDLDRGDENIRLYFENPTYYENLKENTNLGLAKKDGKYYIFSWAGGGNNRLILMKIKYLALANKIENIDQLMTFYVNIRYTPSRETADNIFYLIYPGGGYSMSKFRVLNKSDSPDVEIYDFLNSEIIAQNISGSEIKNIMEQQNELKR